MILTKATTRATCRQTTVMLLTILSVYWTSTTSAFVVKSLDRYVDRGPRSTGLFIANGETATVAVQGPPPPSQPSPVVQRVYETYRWKYPVNAGNTKKRADVDTYYNINYRVEGNGPPVLLVHGFGANLNHFRYQFPALPKAGYRVYAIDLLGFGASDKPGKVPYSIELFSQLLQDFIRDQDPKQPWIIAGNSIGGLCSMHVAQQIPDQIKGLILFNCSGGMSGFRYEYVPAWARPIMWFVQNIVIKGPGGPLFYNKFKTRENVEAILRQQVYGDDTKVDEELMEILLRPSDDEGALQVFLNVIAGPPGPTPESLLPAVQCPILGVWGSADQWTPVDNGLHPATDFPKYYNPTGNKGDDSFVLEVLSGAGHCPHDECPDAVNSKVIQWMKKIQNKAST